MRRSQRGYLLVTVVVTLFLLSTIVMLLVYDSANNANSASSELEAARAEYVAQAGMQTALWRAQNNACLGDVTVPVTNLGDDTFDATIAGAAAGSLVVVNADQDAWIRNDDTERNNGKTASNHVRYESGKIEQVLTRFDVSSISSKARINSAIAWFHLKVGKEHPEGHITVHEIMADWAETSVTWDSFGGAYRAGEVGSIPTQDTGDTWVAVNITSLVQSWVNGQPNHGILFDSTAEGLHTEYTAREDGTNPPRLEIVLGSGDASPVTLQSTGALNSGIKRKLQRTDVPALQPPTTAVLQPGPSDGIDTYTWETNKSTNYETDDEIWASRSTNNTSLSLLKFAVDSIPSSARVISATLSLHHRTGNNSGVPIGAYRVTREWDEDGATWNNRTTGESWATPGGDIDAVAVDAVTVGPPYFVRREWEIGPLVQGWVDGTYENYGVAIATFLAGSTGHRFDSSDHADPSRRPSLTITFACECGSPCVLPRGEGRIALIGDDWTPDEDDQFKIQLLESWGYDVDFYMDRDSGGINWSIYDLAYVSETSIASDVNANLESLSIGVVNEEPNLYDDIRVASGDTENVGSTIDIIDNSHFITSSFSLGPLSIYDGDMEILTANAPLAGGLQTLGEFGGQTTLAALDAGAATTSGTAAGRRVIFPLGQHAAAGFDWQHLNYNGHLLVQRSIDWAMGIDKTPAGRLLFVVGNAGSPSNHDQERQGLFESMGYDVTFLDDGADPDMYKTEINANDIVYVSSSISSGTLGDKLTAMPIGIVNEDPDLTDDFGFGDTTGTTTTYNTFTAMDLSHYIGEPFGGASVTLWASNIVMPLVSGTLAPDLWNAASIGALTWAVPTLAVGAERWDGALSLGRRAHLPFGNASSSVLTDDARTILKRTLEWAAGAGPKYGPIAHWKLDETSGTIAVDSAGGHDGTTSNTEWVPGVDSGALRFNSSSDSVLVPHADELSLTEQLTIAAWINKAQLWGYDGGVVKATTGSDLNYLFGTWEQNPVFGFSTATDNWQGYYATGTTLSTNTWYHMAMTFNNAADRVRIYVDGTLAQEFSTTLEPVTNDGNVMLGRTAIGEYWPGLLDDVRIYDRELGAGEIEKLAQPPIPGTLILATASNATLGGLSFTNRDIVQYDPAADVAVLVLDGAAEGVPQAIDAVHVLPDGDILFSMDASGAFKGTWFGLDDVIRYNAATGTASVYLDGASIMTSGSAKDVRAFHVRDDGTQVLVSRYTQVIGGVTGGSDDIFDFNPGTGSAALLVYGPDVGFNGQYDAVHELENGNLLVSVYASNFVGGNHYSSGDIIEFDYINNTSTTFMDESAFASAADVRAVQLFHGELGSAGGGSSGGGGGGPSYVEKNHVLTVSANNSWRTIDLSGQGVPPNAVVEIAMENTSGNRQREAGIRAVGGSAPTYDLHEAEGGGVDALTKHVQADASGQIQAFAENSADVQFRLLGYWTGGTYANIDGLFTVSSSSSWQARSLAGFGVQPDKVVEIIVQNTNGSQEYLGGVRTLGSGNEQRHDIHEAEAGGKDFFSVFVEAGSDASASIEAYAESTGSIEFKPAGMWVTAPGTYTEHDAVVDIGGPTSNNTWQTIDLSSFGVPPNAVLQITLSNKNNSGERVMGVRSVGSTLDRYVELQEAEGNGEDLVTMHVKADANSRIQVYHSRPADPHRYHLMGWWVLN